MKEMKDGGGMAVGSNSDSNSDGCCEAIDAAHRCVRHLRGAEIRSHQKPILFAFSSSHSPLDSMKKFEHLEMPNVNRCDRNWGIVQRGLAANNGIRDGMSTRRSGYIERDMQGM
jgi:hypothetical protein